MIRTSAVAILLLVALACAEDRDGEPEEGARTTASDTVETVVVPETGGSGSVAETTDGETDAGVSPTEADTTAAVQDTLAEAEELPPPPAGTAPTPPGGYAIETRPAAGGKLAKIEYASPKTVGEVAQFYDSQFRFPQRVVLDIMGDDMVAYGLSANTTIGPATMPQDIERLLDQRSEPVLVVSPWTMQRDDPLIGDLREAGQDAQADALLETKSKVTVISRPPERHNTDESG